MKLLDFILAEDIRQEVGDKHTIVGIMPYDANIQIQSLPGRDVKFPIAIKYALFIRLALKPEEECPTIFNVSIRLDEKEIQNIKGDLNMPKNIQYVNISLSINTILPQKGVLTYGCKFLKNDMVILDYISEYHQQIVDK
jgi:hypothetical protein